MTLRREFWRNRLTIYLAIGGLFGILAITVGQPILVIQALALASASLILVGKVS